MSAIVAKPFAIVALQSFRELLRLSKTGESRSVKALVIGASGFVGEYLMAAGHSRGHAVVGTFTAKAETHLEFLDATDADAVHDLIVRTSPDWVFMTAANPHVDLCETDPAATRPINVDAVESVALSCAEVGSRLMFFSTDYVFDGSNGPYDEHAEPNPLCEYGRQKLEAEELVRSILPDHHVVSRINVVYGWERHGKNFFVRLLRNLRFGESATIPDDQYSTPTYVGDIAEMAWDLAEARANGIYHLAGPDFIDRCEFSKRIAAAFECDPSLIKATSTAELGQAAARPLLGGLVSRRVEEMSMHEPRSVKFALELLYDQESILAGS